MATFPKSPNELCKGMMYVPRMFDKIRLSARGELPQDYHRNFGAPRSADGALCNFLRIKHVDLVERVKQGGSDEEILEWCFEKGRRPNDGDIFMWNAFASKIGFRDFAAPILQEQKQKLGLTNRDDIATMPDLMDYEEGRKK
jgi:hypothetical protein